MKTYIQLSIILIGSLFIQCNSSKPNMPLAVFALNSGSSTTSSSDLAVPETVPTTGTTPAPTSPEVSNSSPLEVGQESNMLQTTNTTRPSVPNNQTQSSNQGIYPLTVFPNESYTWGRTSLGQNKLYPPEGDLWRTVGVVFTGGYLKCSGLTALPQQGEALPTHIKNVSLWKKLQNGNFEYVPGLTAICDNQYNRVRLIPKDKTDDKRLWNQETLESLNQVWLNPDTIYRILISPKITNTSGQEFGKVNDLGKIDSNPSQYFGYEFKTYAGNACFKSFYDNFGYVGDWESFTIFGFTPNGIQKENKSFPFTVLSKSNCIAATGSGLSVYDSRENIAAQIPDLNGQSWQDPATYGTCPALFKWAQGSMTDPNIPEVEGMCIQNPGQANEYINIYAKGYGYNPEELKAKCNGIWRTTPLSMGVYAFEKTRCSADNDPKPEDPKPVCNYSTSLDTSKGKWYTTPTQDTTVSNETVSIKGIHSFWSDQALIYHIKDNCRNGFYDLVITAKNIYGPLPQNYKTFKLTIINTRNNKSYTLEIPASDNLYNANKIRLPIEKGDTDLKILWKNDSYKKDSYDANIQIKAVNLRWVEDGSND
jgi:hypothetical protein